MLCFALLQHQLTRPPAELPAPGKIGRTAGGTVVQSPAEFVQLAGRQSWYPLLLAQWLQQQGVPALPASQLDELSRRLKSGAPGGAADLAGGWQLSWKGAALVLQQRAAEH